MSLSRPAARSLPHSLRRCAALLALLLCGASTSAIAQRLDARASIPASIQALSAELAPLQRVLQQEFGHARFFIGGGSSRSILDALYFGRPLDARDIDIFVVADRKVTRAYAAKVAERCQAVRPGALAIKDLETRPRANPALPPREAARYIAGYGFFLTQPDGKVFDLSLYHSPADLALNGALSVDTVMIPLPPERTLVGAVDAMRGRPYERLVRDGTVVDAYRGYEAWQTRRLELVHPAELQAKPLLWLLRLARSFGRSGYDRLPFEIVNAIQRGTKLAPARLNVKVFTRYLTRVLNDPRADVELQMLKDARVLEGHAGIRRLLGSPAKWEVPTLRSRLEALAVAKVDRAWSKAARPALPRSPLIVNRR